MIRRIRRYLRVIRDSCYKVWLRLDPLLVQRILNVNHNTLIDLGLLIILLFKKSRWTGILHFCSYKVIIKTLEYLYITLCWGTSFLLNLKLVRPMLLLIFPFLYVELQMYLIQSLHNLSFNQNFKLVGYVIAFFLYFMVGSYSSSKDTLDLSGKTWERKVRRFITSTSSLIKYQTYYKSFSDRAMIPDFLLSAGYWLIIDAKNVGFKDEKNSVLKAIQDMSWRRYDVWILNCSPLILMVVPFTRLHGENLNKHNNLLYFQGNNLLLLTERDKHLITLIRDYTTLYFSVSSLLRLFFILA